VQNITCKQTKYTYFSLISQASYILHKYENATYTAMRFPTQSQNLPNDISEVQTDIWADTSILQVSNFLIWQREKGSPVIQKQKRLSMGK
jgi:hypothetical protein